MRQGIGVVLVVLMSLCGTSLALAGQGEPPGQNKLPAPETVVCPIVGTLIEVSWDEVADAFSYDVEYIGLSAQGPAVQESVNVVGPPFQIDLSPFTAVGVHVRALPAPKHAGNPPQSGAPKGDWSEGCLVTLVPTPL